MASGESGSKLGIVTQVSDDTRETLRKIGENIRVARIERNETQERFATRLGVSLPTVRKIETGDPGVSVGSWMEAIRLIGRLGEIEKALDKEESLFSQYERQAVSKRKRASRQPKAEKR